MTRTIAAMRSRLRAVLQAVSGAEPANQPFFPPGHFYSALTDADEIRARRRDIFERDPTDIPGVDLRLDDQLARLERWAAMGPECPFQGDAVDGLRYGWDNEFYPRADGFVLYCMLRDLQPKRVIEVGSGFSSAVVLDTSDRFLDPPPDLVFIEPHTERLRSLLRAGDEQRVTILEQPLQDVDLARFDDLDAGDILLVDSTHVLKTGSDVHRILFEILPRLRSGVVIHLHDVHAGFEYPERWVLDGWSWNEAYALRAFLAFNGAFEILLHTNLAAKAFGDRVAELFPGVDFAGGSSIWLRRA